MLAACAIAMNAPLASKYYLAYGKKPQGSQTQSLPACNLGTYVTRYIRLLWAAEAQSLK